MRLTTQNFMLPVTLFYCIVLCFFGCGADEELPGNETLTQGDRDRILAEALDWNNLQLRGPENEELIYEVYQETPYTGWVVRRWIRRFGPYYDMEIAVPGEEWRYEELFQVRNGKRDGMFTIWHKIGQKVEEGTYKDGLKDGAWTYRHENGQKLAEGTYKEDEQNGAWTYWHENGQKLAKGTYKEGKQDDVWTYWHENGQKLLKGTYKNGVKDGTWRVWDENGRELWGVAILDWSPKPPAVVP